MSAQTQNAALLRRVGPEILGAPTSGSAGTVPTPPHYCELAPPGDEAGVPAGLPALPGHGPLPVVPPLSAL